MVTRTKPFQKAAFTMIELIFAIVIIAITVMSLPMVTQVTGKAIENSIVQEAIFASSAQLMDATSGYWSEKSMLDMNVSHLSRVVDIGLNCDSNSSSSRYRLRPGHIAQPFHRRCLDSNASANIDSNTTVDIYSLDDAEQTTAADIFIDGGATGTADATGYKQLYKSTLDVSPAIDNNIKILTSTVYEDDGTTVLTILRTQSANIGEIDYYKRTF